LEQFHPKALGREQGGAVVGEAGRVEFLDEPVGVSGVLNAIIPLKERAVDSGSDPVMWLGRKLFRRKGNGAST